MNNNHLNKDEKELGAVLLEISMLLMVAGASTERIRNTIDRISNCFGYTTYLRVSQRTIIISVYNDKNHCVFTSFKRTQSHHVNFTTVAEISRISWQVVDEKWSVQQIHYEIGKLSAGGHYRRWVVLCFTGLAGVAFCRLAGGSYLDMAFVLVGTILGLWVRQTAIAMKFNPYMCVYFAALTSSMVAGALVKFDPGINHKFAFATSVLFLIPGIPLINTFSDMIDGNLQNGLIRGLNGFIISFSIALGLLTSMAIYRI